MSASELPTVGELLQVAVEAMGGTERVGQIRMAEAVDHSMATGQHLAVQAGTGTGKSLAYLVPALRYAVRTGRTVVVSTATIALQRQLCERDLPFLAEALSPCLGRKPTFGLLKGRANYLCHNALAQLQDEEIGADGSSAALIPSDAGAQAVRLYEWAAETTTGDRDDLCPGVSDLVWRSVSVDTRSCLGASMCPHSQECFAELARVRAALSDIVVTNHAMLAIDAASPVQLLPPHDVVIVDEAHELESRVTSVISGTLSPRSLRMLRKRVTSFATDQDVDTFQQAIELLDTTLMSAPEGRWDDLPPTVDTALVLLRSAASTLMTVMGKVKESDVAADATRATAHKQALGGFTEIVEVCDLITSNNDLFVVWLSRDDRDERTVHVAPLTVAGVLRDKLFASSTVVLTSATLEAGGSFATMARQWGLPEEQEARPRTDMVTAVDPGGTRGAGDTGDGDPPLLWSSIDVGSPFQHREAAMLYVASDLPHPGRDTTHPDVLARMKALVLAAGGRALGLCSSRRAAEEVANYLRDVVPFPVLCQGDDTTSALIERFAEDEETCLIGTLSLWQGVDVPGAACSLILIDRLPFPRPDDPLMAARQQYVDSRGGNGFMSVAAAHAALLLAQGTGRLLRSVDDRGVIAVLDPRLVTARYGEFLRRSLPDYWETTSAEVACAALQRLQERNAD